MTREEAIKILEQRFDASCRNNLFQNAEKLDYEDALWMAISALRSTPQPGKPLTLDQLREMDGQPVWIVEYPDWGHWELSEDANDYIVDRNLEFYGMKHDDPDGRYGLHKLGWLAYAYPPAHIDRESWVNADEQLPEKQKDVLMLFGTGNMAVGFWHDRDESLTFWCAYTDDGFYTDCDAMPTHWMPLPEPPEEG